MGEQLKFRQCNGTEEISTLFALDIDLLSESKSIDPKALLGKTATVEVEMDGGGKRFIDGIVTRFGMQGQDFSRYSYRLLLRPWFWLATRKTNFKIFQFKTVPDIIDEVLGSYGYPFEKKLTRAYRSWDYCVQYFESDHNFLSRLCELEGIYYYFTHTSGQHTLVFADDIVGSHLLRHARPRHRGEDFLSHGAVTVAVAGHPQTRLQDLSAPHRAADR